MFDQLSHEDFTQTVGTAFQVTGTDQDVKLELFEVSDKKEISQSVCFSLFFKGPEDSFLDQKIYDLRNEKLGEGKLFLVPIRQEADGYVYESVFNRWIESQSQ